MLFMQVNLLEMENFNSSGTNLSVWVTCAPFGIEFCANTRTLHSVRVCVCVCVFAVPSLATSTATDATDVGDSLSAYPHFYHQKWMCEAYLFGQKATNFAI